MLAGEHQCTYRLVTDRIQNCKVIVLVCTCGTFKGLAHGTFWNETIEECSGLLR